jgi:UDP-glucose 4-epimerase
VRQVISACEKVTGRPIAIEVVARRPGDAPALVADPAKIKTRLGWQPQWNHIEAIVESAWRWHQRYPKGYASKAAAQRAAGR